MLVPMSDVHKNDASKTMRLDAKHLQVLRSLCVKLAAQCVRLAARISCNCQISCSTLSVCQIGTQHKLPDGLASYYLKLCLPHPFLIPSTGTGIRAVYRSKKPACCCDWLQLLAALQALMRVTLLLGRVIQCYIVDSYQNRMELLETTLL